MLLIIKHDICGSLKLLPFFLIFLLTLNCIFAMEIKSSAFKDGELIPMKYSCNGDDVSPPLKWSGLPEGTHSLTLIMDDPDAPMGTWDHWVLFNLSATLAALAEAVDEFPEGTGFGKNSWGRNDYGGPCPPDKEHRYYCKLYAIDTVLNLADGVTKAAVLSAMDGHVLGEAVLMGRYDQPR